MMNDYRLCQTGTLMMIPEGTGDFPIAGWWKHGTGKSREPAGWKACATMLGAIQEAAVICCS